MNPLSKKNAVVKNNKIFLLLFILFFGIGVVTALPITNNSLWSLDIEGSNSSSISYLDDVLYIGTRNMTTQNVSEGKGIVYAINSTNKEIIWNFSYGINMMFKLAISNNSAFAISKNLDNYYLFRLNNTNGEQIWNATIGMSLAYPLFYDDKVYVVNGTSLKIYYAENGSFICKSDLNYPYPLYDISIENNYIYTDGAVNLSKIYTNNCTLIWNVPTSAFYKIKKILVGTNVLERNNDTLYSYNKSDGSVLWNATIGIDDTYSRFLEVNNKIYLSVNDGIKVLNFSNGDILDSLLDNETRSEPVFKEPYLYFAENNSLFILNSSNLSQNLRYSIKSASLSNRDILLVNNNLFISGSLNAYRNELNFTNSTSLENSFDAGNSLELKIDNLEDYDENSIKYEWYEDGVEISTLQNISYSKSCGNSGNKNITLFVKDKYFTKSKFFNTTVNFVSCPSSSSSSSGGGGSDNSDIYPNNPIVSAIVVSQINRINEIKAEVIGDKATAKADFTNEKPNQINIESDKISLKTISIEVENSQKDISITINQVEGPLVTLEITHSVVEITPSISNSEIKKAVVTFEVSQSYLDENQATENDIKIKRFVNDKWVNLPISSISYKGDNLLVSAVTPGFSYFAVTLEKIEVKEEIKKVKNIEEFEEVTSWWDKNKLIIGILSIILILGSVIFYSIKSLGNKNGKQKQ